MMKHTRTVKCINLIIFKKLYQQSKIQISLINKHLKFESIYVCSFIYYMCQQLQNLMKLKKISYIILQTMYYRNNVSIYS